MTQQQSNEELINMFRARNALLDGHFLLSSGLHSDRYFQSALLLEDPKNASELGKKVAKFFPGPVDAVVSPAIGGLIIGHEVARAKGCRAIFSEKDDAGRPTFRRGFALSPGEKILIVEDVITTGLSTMEVVSLVERSKADLVGVGALVCRSTAGIAKLSAYGKPVCPLVQLEIQSWEPEKCPLCQKGTPTSKPGSRKI